MPKSEVLGLSVALLEKKRIPFRLPLTGNRRWVRADRAEVEVATLKRIELREHFKSPETHLNRKQHVPFGLPLAGNRRWVWADRTEVEVATLKRIELREHFKRCIIT